MAAECAACSGLGWTCECHPHRPWGGECCGERPEGVARRAWLRLLWLLPPVVLVRLPCRERLCRHGACHCGGPGDACKSCNPDGGLEWLRIEAEAS